MSTRKHTEIAYSRHPHCLYQRNVERGPKSTSKLPQTRTDSMTERQLLLGKHKGGENVDGRTGSTVGEEESHVEKEKNGELPRQAHRFTRAPSKAHSHQHEQQTQNHKALHIRPSARQKR